MYRKILALAVLILGIGTAHATVAPNAYDYSFTALDGKPMPLSQYKGKLLLVVNTASSCGFTEQYAGLQKLWETYRDKGLMVIGVPSNDFGEQEKGTNDEIAQFVAKNYGITFPMTQKVSVKGKEAHPFYQWIDSVGAVNPKWNFHKLLIGTDGQYIDWFASTTAPEAEVLKEAIEKNLPSAQPK